MTPERRGRELAGAPVLAACRELGDGGRVALVSRAVVFRRESR